MTNTRETDPLHQVEAALENADGIAADLLRLSEMLLDETQAEEAIGNVLRTADSSLGPGAGFSLTISQPDHPTDKYVTSGSSHGWTAKLDSWQYENGEGPCLKADRTGTTCVIRDMETDDRFPGFAEVALEEGVRSCISYPMIVRGKSLGSLNAFYRRPDAPDDELIDRGALLSRMAAPLLATWLAHNRMRKLANELEEALEHRGTIERAKGVLMAELGIDEARAFDVLRTQSQHENVKVREIAAELLEHRRAD